MSKLKVGDTVTLNDVGLDICFGNRHGLSHMKTMKMKVTRVSGHSLTAPEKCYEVEVDNVEINQLCIVDRYFDKVKVAV